MVTYTWFTDEDWETSVLWSFSQSNLFLILAISVFGGCDLSDFFFFKIDTVKSVRIGFERSLDSSRLQFWLFGDNAFKKGLFHVQDWKKKSQFKSSQGNDANKQSCPFLVCNIHSIWHVNSR